METHRMTKKDALSQDDVLALVRQTLERHCSRLAGRQVFLFGSRATGHARPRSDYDIGVIGDKPMAAPDYFAIEDDFDSLPTLHKIDWVDFNRVSEKFRQRAMRHAMPIL